MKLVFLLIFSPVLFLFVALLNNEVFTTDPPGLGQRLKAALTTNFAQTGDAHVDAWLRTPLARVSADELWRGVLDAGGRLGWQLAASDREAGSMHWVVTTRWLRFRDDLHLQLRPRVDERVALYIESRSRAGRADLGANAMHIRRLRRELGDILVPDTATAD